MKYDDFLYNQIEVNSLDLDVMVTPYQNLLDEIVRALQSHYGHVDEEMINNKMQVCEFEICITNDWNFSMASGAEILYLKMNIDNIYEYGLFEHVCDQALKKSLKSENEK